MFEVAVRCRQLGVSRSGYCQWRQRAASERARANVALDVRVAALHAGSGRRYGRPRLVVSLRGQGTPAGHQRVRQSLLRQGLKPVYKRPYRVTTDSEHDVPIARNVRERRCDGWQLGQAWVGDIPYLATGEGWLYLACVMDLASRRIVAWSLSERMKAGLVGEALKSAYGRRQPEPGLIMHTARGSQYASARHRQLREDYGMTPSMSRRANCWDNAAMESLFKTLKVERVDHVRYDTRAQARLDIVNWIEGYYHRSRLHSSIGYRSPIDVERSQMAA